MSLQTYQRYEQEVRLPRLEDNSLDLLIGTDHADLIETQLDMRKGKPGEPVAIRTLFGWTICGSASKFDNRHSAHVNLIKSDSDKIIDMYRQPLR